MNRLLRIGFDKFVPTLAPLLIWFFLGIFVDPQLVNINSLFYPLYFLFGVIVTVFAVGANISAYRFARSDVSRNDEIATATIIGVVLVAALSVGIFANLGNFLAFMRIDSPNIRAFFLFAIVDFALYYALYFAMQKLWFAGKNKRANRITIEFNALTVAAILLAVSFAKIFALGSYFIVFFALTPIVIYSVWKFFANFTPPKKLVFRPLNWLKFDLVDVVQDVFMFAIYFFGFANSFAFGPEWVLLISFETLATDAQWDAGGAVNSVAQIDAAKQHFNYKNHRKNAMKFTFLLALATVAMFAFFIIFIHVNFWLAALLVFANILCFFPNNIYSIQGSYLQIHGREKLLAGNKIFANSLRTICSFLPTPFCTLIGMVVSIIYQYFSVGIIYRRHVSRVRDAKVRENLAP